MNKRRVTSFDEHMVKPMPWPTYLTDSGEVRNLFGPPPEVSAKIFQNYLDAQKETTPQ